MNPLFLTDFSISDSLKNFRKSVLIYETIIILFILSLIHILSFHANDFRLSASGEIPHNVHTVPGIPVPLPDTHFFTDRRFLFFVILDYKRNF